MKWNGGCLCGAVRYEASEAPQSAGYCHCGMCQRSSGSVVTASATFPKAAFRFTRGEPVFSPSRVYRMIAFRRSELVIQHGLRLR